VSIAFPEIRVGDPIRHEALTLFPLFTEQKALIDYLLSEEAIDAGMVAVTEVSETGSVPELQVENRADSRVLFLEGEELVGAKQNRILNTSVLIAAHSKTRIPVSCVERGRWAYGSRSVGSTGFCSPSTLRRALMSSVSRSARAGRGHRSDQMRVWEEIDAQQETLGISSETAALSDSFAGCRERIEEFRERLSCIEGASGVVAAVDSRLVTLDLFDRPTTCQKAWNRLLPGLVLDALSAEQGESQVETADVRGLLDAFQSAAWEQVDAVGEGEEYWCGSDDGMQGSILTVDGLPVHASATL